MTTIRAELTLVSGRPGAAVVELRPLPGGDVLGLVRALRRMRFCAVEVGPMDLPAPVVDLREPGDAPGEE